MIWMDGQLQKWSTVMSVQSALSTKHEELEKWQCCGFFLINHIHLCHTVKPENKIEATNECSTFTQVFDRLQMKTVIADCTKWTVFQRGQLVFWSRLAKTYYHIVSEIYWTLRNELKDPSHAQWQVWPPFPTIFLWLSSKNNLLVINFC